MFRRRDLSVVSTRATRAHTSTITPAGVYRKTRTKTNRQTNILQSLKTVIYRVIEITSMGTQIFHGAQAYVSSLRSMETSTRRKGYWENQNGGERCIFLSFKVAPYSFIMIARALRTKAQVICARSKKNVSVCRYFITST